MGKDDNELQDRIDDDTEYLPPTDRTEDIAKSQIEKVITLLHQTGTECVFKLKPRDFISICSLPIDGDFNCPYKDKDRPYFSSSMRFCRCKYGETDESIKHSGKLIEEMGKV